MAALPEMQPSSLSAAAGDADPQETREWLDALDSDSPYFIDDGDWHELGSWLNQICARDGMPPLYKVPNQS